MIAVFVKSNGILVPCKVHPAADGAVWVCPCGTYIIRASHGVLSGMYRCYCGKDVELIVDGQTVDIEELQELPTATNLPSPSAEAMTAGDIKQNDEDFLRGFGIAPDLAITED